MVAVPSCINYFDSLVQLIPKRYYRPHEDEPSVILSESSTPAPTRKSKPSKKKSKTKPTETQENGKVLDEKPKAEKPVSKPQLRTNGVVGEQATTLDELRDRMKARMQQLKRKRSHGKDEDGDVSKRQKRREKKEKLKKEGTKSNQDANKKSKKENLVSKQKAQEISTPKNNGAEQKDGEVEVDLQFSAIAESKAVLPKRKKGVKGGKNALALKKVEEFEENVARLQEEGETEKAEQLLHGAAVSSSLLRAAGVKVQDDKKLIKKSLKRKEREKRKSQREWKGRSKELSKHITGRTAEKKENRRKAKNKSAARIKTPAAAE